MNNNIFGLQIVRNDLLPETIRVPVKKYLFKSWMSDAHFRRMRKKWLKRYGYHDELYFIQAGNAIMANSKSVDRVVDSFKEYGYELRQS